MTVRTRTVNPTPRGDLVCEETGETLRPPADWVVLPPGDATLTRRVKAAGPHWVARERRGRRNFSRGIWAPAERIERLRAAVDSERATPAYARRLAASRERSARQHAEYVKDFEAEVLDFLSFHSSYAPLARALAKDVTDHTTPVGSGTVGRTKRISVERRASAAVIAWLRHQTTTYDDMHIPRVKGQRREVRKRLARRSRALLDGFRRGDPVDPASCPLHRALASALGNAPPVPRRPRAVPLGVSPRKPVEEAKPQQQPAPPRPRAAALGVPTPREKGRLWERGLSGT